MYLINPAVFYIIDLIQNIGCAFFIVGVLGFIIALICGVSYILGDWYDDEQKEVKRLKKTIKISSIVFFICLIVCTILPDKYTMYKMLIASYVTTDNVQKVNDFVENDLSKSLDKITNSIIKAKKAEKGK